MGTRAAAIMEVAAGPEIRRMGVQCDDSTEL
jgi:hypothetical protein